MPKLYGRTVAAFGAAAVLAYSAAVAPTDLPGWLVCPLMRLTGLPCPGCGLSHSFCAISHGEFAAACRYNVWGFVFYALAVTLVAWPFLARQWPGVERVFRTRAALIAPVVLVAAMWSFGLFRIFSQLH